MRITLLWLAALLPVCQAIESPNSFLRAVHDEVTDSRSSASFHRSLDSCPVCLVSEDAGSKDNGDDDTAELGMIRGFFSGIARMARQGQLRAIWDYVMAIGEALIRTPENIHPIGLIESIVLFVDQMGLAADSIGELQVQEDSLSVSTINLFSILEDLIRSIQATLTDFLDLIRDTSVGGVGLSADVIIGILGVISEILLTFINLIVTLFSNVTGQGRRNLKEEDKNGAGFATRVTGLFEQLLGLINKLPLLAEAAGIDNNLTNLLLRFKNDTQGLYNRIQLFWTILTSNTENIQSDATAGEVLAPGTGGVDAFMDQVGGLMVNTLGFSVAVLRSTVDSLEGTALGTLMGFVRSVFDGVAGMQRSLFSAEVQGDSVGTSSESMVLTEIVYTPVESLASPGCERDRVYCLADTLM